MEDCKAISLVESWQFKFYTAWGVALWGLTFALLFVNECTLRQETYNLKWSVLGTMMALWAVVMFQSWVQDSTHRCCNKLNLSIRTLFSMSLYCSMSSALLFWVYYTYSRDFLVIIPALVNIFLTMIFYVILYWETPSGCTRDHSQDVSKGQALWILLLYILFFGALLTLLGVAGYYNDELQQNPPTTCQV